MLINILAIGAVFGGVIAVTAYVPQYLHLLKVKDSTGISVHAWWLWFLCNSLLLFYAIAIKNAPYIIVDGLSCIANLYMIFLTHRYKK